MRKILSKKFWSHGTPLGYMGPLFQRDVRLGAWNLQIPFIWGPVDPPGLVAPQVNAKTLKSLGSWCENLMAFWLFYTANFWNELTYIDIGVNSDFLVMVDKPFFTKWLSFLMFGPILPEIMFHIPTTGLAFGPKMLVSLNYWYFSATLIKEYCGLASEIWRLIIIESALYNKMIPV